MELSLRLFVAFFVFALLLAQGDRGSRRAAAQQPDAAVSPLRMTSREWKKQIEWWAAVLRDDQQVGQHAAKEAEDAIRAIRDPKAIKALEELLLDKHQPYNVQLVCLEPLFAIGTDTALRVLVTASVRSTRVPIREKAAQLIGELQNANDAIPHYVKFLRSPQLATQAAQALSQSGLTKRNQNPDKQLTYALINAIVTKRTVKRSVWYWSDTG